MRSTSRPARLAAAAVSTALVLSACGQEVLVREIEERTDGAPVAAAPSTTDSTEDGAAVAVPTPAPGTTAAPAGTDTDVEGTGSADPAGAADQETGDPGTAAATDDGPVCAEEASGPGVDADEIRLGTILPLSGPTRPLGEQTARVMQRAVSYYNTLSSDPSRPDLNWKCPGRPGIYGREVKLEIASISSESEDDVLQAMRRLIDVEDVLLVRDCYLQASLMGPGHAYAEDNGVITYHCYPQSLPQPELAPHTWALGTADVVLAGLLTGYLVNELGRSRIGLLYDPTYEAQAEAVRSVAKELGVEIVEEVQARAQTAVNGRRSEVLALRNANPDAVIVLDALNATYAGVAAGQLQWAPADSGVAWACNKCWLKFQVDVCGESCAEMITNSASVPFKPYNAGSQQLWDNKQEIFPNEPNDILTFAAILITGGLFIDMADTGVDLTRANLEETFLAHSGPAGAGLPPINTSPDNHFGGEADWLIEFTGESWPNGFADVSGGFISLDDVGVDPAWTSQ